MTAVRTAAKWIAGAVAIALWMFLFPDVQTYREDGRCYETTTYAAMFTTTNEVHC